MTPRFRTAITLPGLAGSVTDAIALARRAESAGFDDLQVRQPDLARIREAIGFTPAISLEQTILDLASELKHRPFAAQRGSTCPN